LQRHLFLFTDIAQTFADKRVIRALVGIEFFVV
jgi:hypothetical protein